MAWWHGIDEGFAGRQPLATLPGAPRGPDPRRTRAGTLGRDARPAARSASRPIRQGDRDKAFRPLPAERAAGGLRGGPRRLPARRLLRRPRGARAGLDGHGRPRRARAPPGPDQGRRCVRARRPRQPGGRRARTSRAPGATWSSPRPAAPALGAWTWLPSSPTSTRAWRSPATSPGAAPGIRRITPHEPTPGDPRRSTRCTPTSAAATRSGRPCCSTSASSTSSGRSASRARCSSRCPSWRPPGRGAEGPADPGDLRLGQPVRPASPASCSGRAGRTSAACRRHRRVGAAGPPGEARARSRTARAASPADRRGAGPPDTRRPPASRRPIRSVSPDRPSGRRRSLAAEGAAPSPCG